MDSDEVLQKLLKGNKRFMSGSPAEKDILFAREATKNSQYPVATVLACSDSRVCPEMIFDTNLGELFVVRNAGNVVDPVSLGSIEFSLIYFKTPLLVVLAHENCDAVTAACDGDKCPPNIEKIVEIIKRSAEKCELDIEKTVIENMGCIISLIREKSEVVRKLEEGGKLKIVGMKYYLEDGRVKIME